MKNKEETRNAIEFTSIFIAILTLGLLAYSLTNIALLEKESSALIQRYGTPALFTISIFLDLIPQYISPVVILGIAIISGLKIYYAIIATILGSTMGAVLGFIIGKKYLFSIIGVLISDKSTEKLIHLINKYGKIIIPLTAISPLPYLPIIIGAMKFSTRNFIIYGLIPRALGITAYAYLFNII